ncbi:Terminase small subunit [Roseobacter sp. AzwK-3b]|uniref:terminase small subunit n=1 Tax=Roseobacter sp. AzwK-3b TaxID=351016 RepID=UPI0001568AF8|nr:terminase small subunit [Roseobacter sp. AzwK-3b]EDM71422.1 Terminase small subunit [Roseobacter sp. AzwK-3b]
MSAQGNANNQAKTKLTAKQERFVAEYLIDLNATQAAIRAGYSKKTARQAGAENLSKPDIADAVATAKAERAERTEINADWVLRRLADEVTADLADLYDEAGAIKPIHEWPLIWRQGLIAGHDVYENTIEGEKVGEAVKLRLSDRVKRLELIAKHVDVQAFVERKEHTGKGGGPIQTEGNVNVLIVPQRKAKEVFTRDMTPEEIITYLGDESDA